MNEFYSIQTESFINTLMFPRHKSTNVDGYEITITEYRPEGTVLLDKVFIKQLYEENPIQKVFEFTPTVENVYELPKNIIHTEYYNIIVELNSNYLDKKDYEYDSSANTISIKNSVQILGSDTIKVYCYVDSMVYEFESEYECSLNIDIKYNKSHKIGNHNILI